MVQINRRRQMGKIDTGSLYDAEVEYLQSNGTQYIDTGIVINAQDYGMIIDAITNKSTCPGTVRWSNSPVQTFGIYRGGIGVGISFFFGTSYKYVGTNNEGRYVFSLNVNGKNTVTKTLDGDIYREAVTVDSSVLSNTFPMLLFSFNALGQPIIESTNTLTIYSCQILKGGNVIADFIPVRKGTVGYVYDKVSGQLFGNSGTGSFIVGADK